LSDAGAGTTLAAANSAWLDDSLTPNSDWVNRIKAYYQADTVNTDLQSDAALGAVNDWIDKKTDGLIPKMLDSIGHDDAALLVNALYLKAAWAQEFDTDNTGKGPFQTASGATVTADFMSADPATRRYFNTGSAEGVVLPYKDGRLVFVAAMPASGDLALEATSIASWLDAAQDHALVGLSMPKFQTQYGADLSDPLKALGLESAFDTASADLSGIGTSSKGPLAISQVLHKVSMSVGEKGTQAAAATVVVAPDGAAPPTDQPIHVDFNRPYVYAVVDQATGVPLFIGAMDDPSLAPPEVS
jgi:serpin B